MAGKASRIMSRKAPEIIEVTSQRFDELLERAESNTLRDDDRELLRQIFASYAGFFQIVGDKHTTIARLRKLLFGATTETSKSVLGDAEQAPNVPAGDTLNAAPAMAQSTPPGNSSDPPSGHGRNGANNYPGAEQVDVKHPDLAAGDACPDCAQGTVYSPAAAVTDTAASADNPDWTHALSSVCLVADASRIRST